MHPTSSPQLNPGRQPAPPLGRAVEADRRRAGDIAQFGRIRSRNGRLWEMRVEAGSARELIPSEPFVQVSPAAAILDHGYVFCKGCTLHIQALPAVTVLKQVEVTAKSPRH
jgi:hypothetical protein